MNLEEIREAARERDYEDEPAEPFEVPKPDAPFDLRGLAEAMAPKLVALAEQFAVATEKLADILDKAWTDIVEASKTAPATGLRGEGASLLLDGMIKVIDAQDEAASDDTLDAFARAREMLGTGSAVGSLADARAVSKMEEEITKVSIATGESVESIRDSVRRLAETSTKSRSEVLADAHAAIAHVSERSGDLKACLYSKERLVAVSDKLEATHSMSGAVRFEAKFSAANEHQARAIRSAALTGVRPLLQIEDGMATPYAKWTLGEVDVRNYYTSAERGEAIFFGFDVGSFE